MAALIQGTDGNLYGTIDQGGTNGGGAAFRLVFPSIKDRKQAMQQALSALLPSGNKDTDKRLQTASGSNRQGGRGDRPRQERLAESSGVFGKIKASGNG